MDMLLTPGTKHLIPCQIFQPTLFVFQFLTKHSTNHQVTFSHANVEIYIKPLININLN